MRSKTILVATDTLSEELNLRELCEKENFSLAKIQREENILKFLQKEIPVAAILGSWYKVKKKIVFCEKLRNEYLFPIIFWTPADADYRAEVLQAGADVCIDENWSAEDILALLKALLRRTGTNPTMKNIHFPNLDIDVTHRQVKAFGYPIYLRKKEYDLLVYLTNNVNRILPREQLLLYLCGSCSKSKNLLSLYIERLRSKLQLYEDRPWRIETIYGVGYRFTVK